VHRRLGGGGHEQHAPAPALEVLVGEAEAALREGRLQGTPAKIDIQNAWLLYNIGNDRALYPALMRIGGRTDLTVAEREVIQDIWANWSVRRAAAAMDNGNAQRAVDLWDALQAIQADVERIKPLNAA